MVRSSGHGDPHGLRPKRPRSTAGYLEALSRPVFSAGMSWRVVEAKWPGIKEAFLDFDPAHVGDLTPGDVDRLMLDSRVIRNRPKIEATIENARTMASLAAEFGSMTRYLAAQGGFEEQARDLKSRFRFVGDMGAYQFLWAVGEQVPDWGSAAAPRLRRPAKKTGS